MANKPGTPLTAVEGFSSDAASRLAELWITTAEEFASAAYQPPIQADQDDPNDYPDGRGQLATYLGLATNDVEILLRAVEAVLPEGVSFDEQIIPVAMGALPVEDVASPEDEPVSFAELPVRIDLRAMMPPVRNQMYRGTCVAHAVTAVREYLLGAPSAGGGGGNGDGGGGVNLSEQYLYWACKQRDGYPGSGTYISTAMTVLQELGVCPELVWQYNEYPIASDEGQGPPPPDADSEATPYRITNSTYISPRWVNSLKEQLAAGSPIAFQVPLYSSFQQPYGFRGGDVRMPLPNEKLTGYHAMCMVGYEDDAGVPGGGYFIVRNSWGKAFGHDGEVAPGYCRLPYEYMTQYGNAAYTAGGNMDEIEIIEHTQFKFRATAIPGDRDRHRLRPEHNTSRNFSPPEFWNNGDIVEGDELWAADGELWLRVEAVTEKSTNTQVLLFNEERWTSIYHQGKRISVLESQQMPMGE